MQYRSLNWAPQARTAEKCVKFAIANGPSPKKIKKWMIDRNPNRIRTLSEVQKFWTPIYTSNKHEDHTYLVESMSTLLLAGGGELQKLPLGLSCAIAKRLEIRS